MTAERRNEVTAAAAPPMAKERLKFPEGSLERLKAPIKSPVLLALPEKLRPKPIVACTSCPEGSWSLDEKLSLTCHCEARRYVAWTANTAGLILCDDREAALSARNPPDPPDG